MAQTTIISQRELKRIAAAAYEGETLKVMLCNVGVSGYTAESTVANWQSVEISGNGYARFTASITTGAYNSTNARYQMPNIDAAFSATGSGFSYDRVVLYIDGETYIHSIIEENPNVTVAPSQTQTYRLVLATDD